MCLIAGKFSVAFDVTKPSCYSGIDLRGLRQSAAGGIALPVLQTETTVDKMAIGPIAMYCHLRPPDAIAVFNLTSFGASNLRCRQTQCRFIWSRCAGAPR